MDALKKARRRSELDVESVAKEIEEQKDGSKNKRMRKTGDLAKGGLYHSTNGAPYAQAAELLDDVCYSGQVHENDLAEVVVVCEPGE